MKHANIAILGLGTVGGGTYQALIQNHEHMKKNFGVDLQVIKVLERSQKRLDAFGVPAEKVAKSFEEILDDPTISIVVEVIGGIGVAKDFIIAALSAKKSVVTANKELVAKHWGELEQVAKANKVGLYFEASCVGGVPIIRTLTDSMQANNVLELIGIINGTTNYMLTKMTEEDSDYSDVLKEAQDLGYAELDPSADVDGFDVLYKLSILSSLAFKTSIPISHIYREGISKISKQDIQSATEMGYVIKLLAIGRKNGNLVEARVHPTFVPKLHPLASVRDSFNAVHLVGDFVEEIMLYGRGAGARPTASAIVSDIVVCAKAKSHSYVPFKISDKPESKIKIVADFQSKYYLRLLADDRAGVLAKITAILGKMNVSIESVLQKKGKDSFAPVIFLTHETNEAAMQKAISALENLPEVKQVQSLIRVL